MTQKDALRIYRELAALEHLAETIRRQFATSAAPFEWTCCLKAMEWQIREDRYVLSQEDPTLIGHLSELLRAEQEHARVSSDTQMSIAEQELPELPKGSRVH